MNKRDWNESLNNIAPELVEEHILEMEKIAANSRKKPTLWLRYIAVAAAVCLVFGTAMLMTIFNSADDPVIPEGDFLTTDFDSNIEYPSDTESGEEKTTNSETESTEETTANSETDSTEETTETPETENNEPYEIKVDDYTLLKNENGCYLTFDDISKYKNNSSSGSMVVGDITFKSIKEFKDTVTKGLLEDWQKSIVADFSSNGVDIQTCDFNNLYEPTMPQGSTVAEVYWKGDAYSYYVKMSDESFGYVRYHTKDIYERKYQQEYVEYFDKDTVTITGLERIDEKEIIHYKTSMASLYNVRYTLTSGDKALTVDKRYYSSDDIPNRVTLYCTDGILYYTVMLHSLKEDPTDEWLLQFGLKRYVENDHEVM